MSINSYTRFKYDLELKTMLKNYETNIENAQLIYKDKTPKYFIGLLKFVVDQYCKFKKVNFKKNVQIIIEPVDEGAYYQLLGNSLIFYEKHRIRPYLNYQEKKYLKYFPNNSFEDLVEFIIVDIVNWASPIDNSSRLKIIMDWVEDKRRTKLMPTPPPRIDNNDLHDKLIWTEEFAQLLNSFSMELSTRKYTLKAYDFSKVFQKQSVITWNKGLASWLYLMSKIRSLKYITTNKGSTPYLKIGHKFFNFCNEGKNLSDQEKKTLKDKNFSQLLHNITKRTEKKYLKIMKDVDSMIESVIKSQKIIKPLF